MFYRDYSLSNICPIRIFVKAVECSQGTILVVLSKKNYRGAPFEVSHNYFELALAPLVAIVKNWRFVQSRRAGSYPFPMSSLAIKLGNYSNRSGYFPAGLGYPAVGTTAAS